MRQSSRRGLLPSSDDDSCCAVAEEKKLCIHTLLWIQDTGASNIQHAIQYKFSVSASCFPFHHHLFINAPCNLAENNNWDHILCHATHVTQNNNVILIIFFSFSFLLHDYLSYYFYLPLYFRNYCKKKF